MCCSAFSFLWPNTLSNKANAKMSIRIFGGGENFVFICTDTVKERNLREIKHVHSTQVLL